MKLIVGLGNPGPEYVWSRHNSGWLAADHIAIKTGSNEPRMQFFGAFWPSCIIGGVRTSLLKPLTYMNDSGRSVAEAARYFDIPPEDVLIIFDDVAIPFGRLRYRDRGSAGGQNGMKSIIGRLGTDEIPRLRVGVGAPEPKVDMKDWVLGKFTKEQRDVWPDVADLAWNAVVRWVKGEAGRGFTMDLRSPEADDDDERKRV